MKFSVIVVSLNAGEDLRLTVDSILKQTYTDYEIVIKDGGSSDGSLDFLEDINDKRIKPVFCPDSSIYDGMNQAVTYGKGEYFIFMNAGDVFADEKVLAAVAKFSATGRYQIIYGDMRRKGQDTIIPYPDRLTDFGLFRNVPCHQVCFYSKELFSKRAYDLTYKVRCDYEHFLWSIYSEKAVTAHIRKAICVYEGGGYSETKENRKISAMEHKAITKKYQGKKAMLYRMIMIITLQPLRQWMAENKATAAVYQGIKGIIYGKK